LIFYSITLTVFIGCSSKQDSHTDSLLFLNDDFKRYYTSIDAELSQLYNDIDAIDASDSIDLLLIDKASEIRKHSDRLMPELTMIIEEVKTNYSVEIPEFKNFSSRDWKLLHRSRLLIPHGKDIESIRGIKAELVEFHMHLIYINQKVINSNRLEDFLRNSIKHNIYISYIPWEKSLIEDKSTLDLIITLNKIKYEMKLGEFMTIKSLHDKLNACQQWL
jgi:hypothetical protein